jgi:phosphoribosylformimino-5-aminoimidazole carboxamide ribotide isomerase
MIVIPAIDLKAGKCVRLKQGQMSKETIYSESPSEMAVTWYEQGAERLHLVDLDGAVGGKPTNRHAIRDILKSVPIPAELGGGIRNMATVEAYLELGVTWVILGTAAIKDAVFVEKACAAFPGRIILAIDAKNNLVAVEGWTEPTTLIAHVLARKFEGMGVSAIVYTDIERDGMSVGPNLKATEDFARQVRVPVIASGGISGIEDVRRITALADFGVVGMITGRALYEGKLNLRDALKVAGDQNLILRLDIGS